MGGGGGATRIQGWNVDGCGTRATGLLVDGDPASAHGGCAWAVDAGEEGEEDDDEEEDGDLLI